jgi:hypothetical protein
VVTTLFSLRPVKMNPSTASRLAGGVLPLFLLAAPGCAPAPAALGPAPGVTAAEISPDDLRHRVFLLADDSMRGRATGTPEIAAAAGYLVAEATRLGLRPAGDDGTFYNRSELQRRLLEAQTRITSPGGSHTPGLDELIPVSGLVGLPAASQPRGSGPLLYAGHLVDPAIGAAELRAVDVAGAAVIVRLSPPAGIDPQNTPPRMPVAALFGPASTAAAVLLVAEEGEQEIWSYVSGIARSGSIEQPGGETPPRGPAFFMISPQLAERVLGAPLAGARQPRADLGAFEFELREQVTPVDAWNIVALLPGRDPARAGQYVSVGAHYDHVGIGAAVEGDSIYNGADDNASGTAGLLEVAEYLASLPQSRRPARSVLFLWYTAEEHGLLGSRTFTDAPTVPRDSIVVNVNADMLGRNSPDSISVIGAGRLSSELAAEVEAVNRRLARPFLLDYSYDRRDHPERLFCRSDHYNFARFVIPTVYLTTGLHEDYHQPSDTPDRLDYDKIARAARLIGDLTLALADRPARLVIDQPVDEADAECRM